MSRESAEAAITATATILRGVAFYDRSNNGRIDEKKELNIKCNKFREENHDIDAAFQPCEWMVCFDLRFALGSALMTIITMISLNHSFAVAFY